MGIYFYLGQISLCFKRNYNLCLTLMFLRCSSQGIEYVINDARLSDPQQWSEVGVAHYFLGGTS